MFCYTELTKEDAMLSAKEETPMFRNYRPRVRRVIAFALVLTMLLMEGALAATRYSTLEFGSRGSDVLKLQKALLTLGFDPSGTDGKFGRGTENAVMLYQASKSLTADGTLACFSQSAPI